MPSRNTGGLASLVRNYFFLNHRVKLTLSWLMNTVPDASVRHIDQVFNYFRCHEAYFEICSFVDVGVHICLGKMVKHCELLPFHKFTS